MRHCFRLALTFLLSGLVVGVGSGKELTDAEVKAMFVETPAPDYSLVNRQAQRTGRGVYRVSIDESGRVTAVDVVTSSGHPELDRDVIKAFTKWKAKPGAKRSVEIPFSFNMKVNRMFISALGAKVVPIDSSFRGRIVVEDPKTSRKIVYSRREVKQPGYSLACYVDESLSDDEASRILRALDNVQTIPRW